MAIKIPPFSRTQEALDTPFEPLRNPGFGGVPSDLTSDDVQNAIEEVNFKVENLAHETFTFGRSGNLPTNTWLLCDSIPSNITGRDTSQYNATIDQISVSNVDLSTCTLGIYEHDKVTYTLLTSISLVAAYRNQATLMGIAAARGKEIAVRVTAGSLKDAVVNILMKGTDA